MERRMPSKIAARLHRCDDRTVSDVVSIEDISSHGARVIGHLSWQPHDHVTLAESIGDFSADAEVVYCQRVGEDMCAVGLKFERDAHVQPLTGA
ncbi:MAG: PilZ domain-containing protein [Steroidobacteraceae bacterium]